jgi:hypothetical protein
VRNKNNSKAWEENITDLDLHIECRHSLRDVVAYVDRWEEEAPRGYTGNLSGERARMYCEDPSMVYQMRTGKLLKSSRENVS